MKELQDELNSLADLFIESVRDRTLPSGYGIFATWEQCFRMAMRGECDPETVDQKLRALAQHFRD